MVKPITPPPRGAATANKGLLHRKVVCSVRREVSTDPSESYGVLPRRQWRNDQIETIRRGVVGLSGDTTEHVVLWRDDREETIGGGCPQGRVTRVQTDKGPNVYPIDARMELTGGSDETLEKTSQAALGLVGLIVRNSQ